MELPPQPTTVAMIKASAKIAAAGCRRKNVFCLVRVKMKSEQAISNARNLAVAKAGAGEAIDVPAATVVSAVGPEPVPPLRFERPARKPSSEKPRLAAGGGVADGGV